MLGLSGSLPQSGGLGYDRLHCTHADKLGMPQTVCAYQCHCQTHSHRADSTDSGREAYAVGCRAAGTRHPVLRR